MRLQNSILFILLIITTSTSGQTDSSKIFENQKGKLSYPLQKFSNIVGFMKDNNYVKCSCMTFISDSSHSINAIFDGNVVEVQNIEGLYIVITKFGKYLISYSGLKTCYLEKGTYIKTGAKIGDLGTLNNNDYELELYITNKNDYLNPEKWFRK